MIDFQSMGNSIGTPILNVNRQTDAMAYQNSDMNTLGQRIKARRKELKLTQKQLGAKIGMSQANISELESDLYPTSGATAQLAHALKVNAIWLAEGTGPMLAIDHSAASALLAESSEVSGSAHRTPAPALAEDEQQLLAYFRESLQADRSEALLILERFAKAARLYRSVLDDKTADPARVNQAVPPAPALPAAPASSSTPNKEKQ